MKGALLALAIIALVAGCHKSSGQLPPTAPPLPSCPAPGNAAYTPLNPSGTASTSFTATGVTTQTCFIAQGVLGSLNGAWSNVVGPTVGGATNSVNLNVTCTVPTPNPQNLTCTGVKWVFSSAAAVVPPYPATPTTGPPTTSQVVKPDPVGQLALNVK